MKLVVGDKELKAVIVKWIDASHENGDWDEKDSTGLVESYVSGWYIGESILHEIKYVTIGMEYFPHSDSWREVAHIPKCLIKNIIGLD